jgi:hypothetical protein
VKFEKGRSGNPGGRPRGHVEIRDLARRHTAVALEALVDVATNGKNENARAAAANALLDRAWGRPVTSTTAENERPVVVCIAPEDRNL